MKIGVFILGLLLNYNTFSQFSTVLFSNGTPTRITSDNQKSILREGQRIYPSDRLRLKPNDELIIIAKDGGLIQLKENGEYKFSDLKPEATHKYIKQLYGGTQYGLSEKKSNDINESIDSLYEWALGQRYPTRTCASNSSPTICLDKREDKALELQVINLQIRFNSSSKNRELSILSLYGVTLYLQEINPNKKEINLDLIQLKEHTMQNYFVLMSSQKIDDKTHESNHVLIELDSTRQLLHPQSLDELLILGYYFDYNSSFAQAHHCFKKAYEDYPSQGTKQQYLDFLHQLGGDSSQERHKLLKSATRKPVIYLYPKQNDTINIKINYDGQLTYTYPQYNDSWKVIAKPNGDLINLSDQTPHSYLFYEGEKNLHSRKYFNSGNGFCFKGNETIPFLQNNLKMAGLSPKEYNDFIVYWLPFMQDNPYNQVYFLIDDEYDSEISTLTMNPYPTSQRKVFMLYRRLEQPIELSPQKFPLFERNGFTLIEWGGAEIKD